MRGANAEVGGRVLEMAQHEYVVRGRGYVQGKDDIELAVVTTDARGTPVRIRDVADVVDRAVTSGAASSTSTAAARSSAASSSCATARTRST